MILVTGKNGQLGFELQKLLGVKAIFLSREELDLSRADQLKVLFTQYKFDTLINTAAYTQVDKAEDEQKVALAVNAEAPGILAELCLKNSVKFIHYSTDYVFDGKQSTPYQETDKVSPVNFYGETKLLGETHVLAANPQALILRTSWVYSAHGKNFVKTMLKFGDEREELKVVADQIGSPTWGHELAKVTLLARDKSLEGLYHYSQEHSCSWYEFACAIKEKSSFKAKIYPIQTSEYPTKAARPQNSLLSKDKIKKDLNISIPHWKESLDLMLADYLKAH